MVFELCLIHLLGKELTEDRSHVIFAHMNFPQRLDALRALLVAIFKDEKHEVVQRYETDILPLLRGANTKRNSGLHSKWMTNKDGTVRRMTLTARGVLKITNVPMTARELEKIGQNILDTSNALFNFVFPNHQMLPRRGGSN